MHLMKTRLTPQQQPKTQPHSRHSGVMASQLMASPLMQRRMREQQQFIAPVQRNCTGLPDNLKVGMERLSGMNLDHVRVHYNSPKPAAVQAYAFAQGHEIHVGRGQEEHVPHELGHVVQQMEGRVQATTRVGGVAVNDNPALEREADCLGARALQMAKKPLLPEFQNQYDHLNNQ